ncbi:MAG: hypothetical protein IH889_08040 [Planctomycetes bacterium]|nr:hypothetical protein [Planctomycetota bacterium]
MRSTSANDRRITLLTAALVILLGGSGVRGQCEVAQLVGSGGPLSARISADVAVVGDSAAFGFLGAANVFRRGPDGPQDWTLEAVLMAPEPDVEDVFGLAVAVSGGVIVIGAPDAAAPEFHSGAAYIFRHDPATGQWGYEATLTASDGDMGDIFGWSVSIDGDAVLIGARDDENDGVSQSGSAYVFRYNPDASVWVEEAKLTDPDGEQGDLFGVSVSIQGDAALIGAHGNDDAGGGTGAAFVFRRDAKGSGDWLFEQQLTAFDAQWLAWFGVYVSLADDVAVIGAPQLDSQIGAAYVLRYDGKSWVHEAKLLASEPVGPFPLFGLSVAINNKPNSVVIGAPHDFALGFEAGAAYVFRYDPDESPRWKEVIKLTASDGGPGHGFGSSSVSEDIALIRGGGKAYVFAGIQGLDCNDNGEPDACDIFDGTSDDGNGNGVPDECDADLNGDGLVGILDLLMLLAAWGPCDEPCPPACLADLDGNCTVNVLDLLILVVNWG